MAASDPEEAPPMPRTPRRQKEAIILPFASPFKPTDPTWTAKRYSILMRSLEAQLKKLRDARDTSSESTARESYSKALSTCTATRRTISTGGMGAESHAGPEHDPRGFVLRSIDPHTDEDIDPDWQPHLRNRKKMKVYKSQNTTARRQENFDVLAGKFPALTCKDASRRVRSDDVMSLADGRVHHLFNESTNRAGSEVIVDSRQCLLIESRILDTFEQILIHTRSSEERRGGPGVTRLLHLCLNAIPPYVEQLEDNLEDDDECANQVANQVFSTLEQSYSTTIKGWKPIRVAIRAMATNAVGDVITKGILSRKNAYKVLSICKRFGTTQNSDRIYDALFQLTASLRSTSQPSEHVADDLFFGLGPPELLRFWTTAMQEGDTKTFFEILPELFIRGILPADWLGSQDIPTVLKLSIEPKVGGSDAFQYALESEKTVILFSCGVKPGGRDILPEFLCESDLANKRISTAVLRTTYNWLRYRAIGSSPLYAQKQQTRLCELANEIVKVQRSTVGQAIALPRETSFRRSVILFACLLLSKSSSFKQVSCGFTFEQVWTEWIKITAGIPVKEYVYSLSGLRAATEFRNGVVRELNEESWYLQQATIHHHNIRLAAEVLMKGLSTSHEDCNIRLPRALRVQVCCALEGIAIELSFLRSQKLDLELPDERDLVKDECHRDYRIFDTCEKLIGKIGKLCAREKRKGNACDCSLAACLDCQRREEGWQWDPALEEYVRSPATPRNALGKNSEFSIGLEMTRESMSRLYAPQDRRGTLSALTDTPLISRFTKVSELRRSAPCTLSHWPLIFEDDIAKRGSSLRRSLDGVCDSSDEDELSILQERPVNSKLPSDTRLDSQAQDLPAKGWNEADTLMWKSTKKPIGDCLIIRRPLAIPRRSSTMHLGGRDLEVAAPIMLKRKRSAFKIREQHHDLSEDELTL